MIQQSFEAYYSEKVARVETCLTETFPELPEQVGILEESMRYSLLAGGKRLRPILILTTIECAGKSSDFALPLSCAMEYIHTYSLIHDDLPCMDDDELRRGMPTNHIRFGEDVALLAGDALLTHAFALMSMPELLEHVSAETVLKSVHLLAENAGVFGMVSGQVADIQNHMDLPPADALTFIHSHKTGALIKVAVQMGALLSGVGDEDYQQLTGFGVEIGKCFQIQDDILDVIGSKERLGKTPGTDEKNETLTYPRVFGLDRSQALAGECYDKALNHLERTSLDTERLRDLADFVLKRDH